MQGMRHMLLAALFFSIMTVFVKLAGDRIPSAEIVLVRSLFSVVVTFVMLRRVRISPWGNRKGLLLFRGLAGCAALLCFYYSIPRMPLADATVIQFLHPLFVAFFAALFLREALGWGIGVSTVLSLVGIAFIARPTFLFGGAVERIPLFVVAVALGGAILAAMAYTLVRKLRETEHALVVVLYFPLVSVPAVLPLVWPDFVWPTPVEWGYLLGVGLFTQIAQVYLTKGLHSLPAGRATAISYTQILFAGFWGVLLFGELPDALMLLGVGLVITGAYVVVRKG